MSKRAYLSVSGAIFAVVALFHLTRALLDWAFQLGPWSVPLWFSWIGFLGGSALAVWAWRLNRN